MTKFIAIVSGKGGTGKTTASLNIGQALTTLGKKVVVVDTNFATPNLAIQLGFMNPEGTINKFLRKEKALHEITYLHESGLSIIPASPSYTEFQKTNPQKMGELFEHLDDAAEFVLLDAPSGLGFEVSEVLKNSDEAIIVVNPTLSSVMEAVKTIQLAQAHNATIAGIILNMTHRGKHELKSEEVQKILGYQLIATIKDDKKIRKSVFRQMPLTYLYPRSRSAKEFKKIAQHLTMDHEKT